MKLIKKAFTILLSFLLIMSVLAVPSFADGTSSGYSQTHTVDNYITAYSLYKIKYGKAIGSPMDGTYGTPDLCIPGLSEADGMVPQGIAYWANENLFIISAHGTKDGQGSMLFLLDGTTGKLQRQYTVYYETDKLCRAHLGGIAVSDYNLYLTGAYDKIGYIPLSCLKENSTNVKMSGSKTIAGLNGAYTSYLSLNDGCLWTGNYFYEDSDSYNKRASDANASLILGFKLSGESSEAEWESIRESPQTYIIKVPDSIDKIQSAAVSDDKLYLSTSYGRKSKSTLYTCSVDLSGSVITLSESDMTGFSILPMAEGICIYDGKLYYITESAAASFSDGKDPSDVVWKTALSDLISIRPIARFFDNMDYFYQVIIQYIKLVLTYLPLKSL